jgi:hypothetical protein
MPMKAKRKPTVTELFIESYVELYRHATGIKKDSLKCEAWKEKFKWNEIVDRIEVI